MSCDESRRRQEAIYHDQKDAKLFVQTLAEACARTEWEVHAYCLMSNHFHLVVETPNANLVAGMKWFLGTYTSRFNRRHRYFGHLFSGRYKSLIVDGSGTEYLRTVCNYVHLNPARAGLVKKSEPLKKAPLGSTLKIQIIDLKQRKRTSSWTKHTLLLSNENKLP